MGMRADEALRRAAWLAQHKDENPQNYFTEGNGSVGLCTQANPASKQARDEIVVEGEPKTTSAPNPLTGTLLETRQQRPAKAKSPAYANDQEILRLVHSEWDAQGLTPSPQALTKAIHGMGHSRPERFRHMDGSALRKAYLRARARLPAKYDHWIGLVQKWDKSYTAQMARSLIDRLVTALGDRSPEILDELFDHLERQICDHWPKKVRRLECECDLLKNNNNYQPQLRRLKTDAIKEQVYAALADEPKTKEQLAQMFGRSISAMSSIGRRLRNENLITSIWREEKRQFVWARADTASLFIPARDAIVTELEKGPKTIPELARDTGKGTSTIKSALQRHLLPNRTVVRTEFGTYALVNTAPSYVSRGDAIVEALKNGPMTVQALAREIRIPPSSLPQFLDPLLAEGTVIRIKHGIYALRGSARAYVPTCDAIISALTKKAMRLGPLVQNINRSTRSTRSRGTVTTVLGRLKKEGIVKQDRWGGEYRLARERVRGGRELGADEKERPPSASTSFGTRRARRLKSHSNQRHRSTNTLHLLANALQLRRRAGHRVVHKRVVRLVRRNSRGSYSSRRCIPYDVRAEHARLYGPRSEVKFSAPASVGAAEARRRFREWDAEITSRFEAIRKTQGAANPRPGPNPPGAPQARS
jgi:predicted transcriptional regulator